MVETKLDPRMIKVELQISLFMMNINKNEEAKKWLERFKLKFDNFS